MSEFLNAIFEGALVGIILSVAGWVIKKVHDQNEEIEEIFSRLQDCEEKLSQLEK